jgi:hypothetical protein
MEEQEAINLINQRIQDLRSNNFDPIVWTDTTCELMRRVFSESFERKIESIEDISYIVTAPMAGPDIQARRRQQGILQAEQYLTSFTQEIQNHGMENSNNQDVKPENKIIALLKNVYFWGVLVIVIGASFALGKDIGVSKFDKEKKDWYDENKSLKEDNKVLKDSVNMLKVKIVGLSKPTE